MDSPGGAQYPFFGGFGETACPLHRVTPPATGPAKSANFGLGHDNYMGAPPQGDTPADNWPDFFIHRRLEPQIRLVSEQGLLPAAARDRFQWLYQVLPAIFEPEPPALRRQTFCVWPSAGARRLRPAISSATTRAGPSSSTLPFITAIAVSTSP